MVTEEENYDYIDEDSDSKYGGWKFIPPNRADKSLHKSAFLHGGCTIPADYQEFFGIQTLQLGDKKPVNLVYKNKTFNAYFTARLRANTINRTIQWHGDFSSLIQRHFPVITDHFRKSEKKLAEYPKMQFIKRNGNDEYEIQFIGNDLLERNQIHHDIKKQVILYGPPGTGKTYKSVIRAYEIIFGDNDPTITFKLLQEKLKKQGSGDRNLSQFSWVDAIILAFDEIGKKNIQVRDIIDTDVIKKFSVLRKSHKVSNTIWYTLQRESRMDSETVHLKNKSGKELFDKDKDSNWFLTDNGQQYRQSLIEDLQISPETASSQFNFVTFHQSFSYEDFIEGIRPKVQDPEEGTISYEIKDGIFKEMCNNARLFPHNNYVLIIDEINRGNISKIFGELITLLEDNKRSGEAEEITVTLPYSGHEFSIPNNVYIIGTMNSTDKSIALVDIALRRRFYFERLDVNYELIKNQDARIFLSELNGIICALKNPDYEIGHYYLMSIPEYDTGNAELEKVFFTRILPLLEEYFFNDWEALATILGRNSIKIEKRKKLVWDEDSGKFEEDSGDTDQIYGLSIDKSTVFKGTMSNLGIHQ
ncbi:MAG: AAA family ATPase [Methanospirillaceae archaeon]|nr:AAA family ATPase [Methanospirillaceae archaeon]